MKTPHEIANELATKAAKPFASKNDRINISSTVYENVRKAIEADRAQQRDSALSVMRLLNDLDLPDETLNEEYLRGQVELIADLFGDGHGEYTDAKYIIYAELGVEAS